MLLIMSDLHFVDGTAGDHNLPVTVFKKVLRQLNLKNRAKKGRIKELRILFLGDIFDVVRSQEWFGGDDPAIRPWGHKHEEWSYTDERVRFRTHEILQSILNNKKVAQVCAYFKKLESEFEGRLPVYIHYVPGNHDRFFHTDPEGRQLVADHLGISEPAVGGFPRTLTLPEYGVVAFHGHEVDLFNFGGTRFRQSPDTFDEIAYGEPSFGEAITIDIASRIPHLVINRMKEEGYSADEIAALSEVLDNMDNIRPVETIFPWLSDVTEHIKPSPQALLDEVIEQVFDDFAEWEFVKKWSEIVDQGFIPRDAGALTRFGAWLGDVDIHEHMRRIDKLDSAKDLLLRGVGNTKTSLDRYQDIANHKFYEQVIDPELSQMRDHSTRYLVYGHTHVPEMLPIESNPDVILLNTGTFRPRILACRDDAEKGFVTMKALSFVTINRDDEEIDGPVHQKFEIWEGNLAEE